MDFPEMIMELSSKYPEFKAMYEHVYNICQNVEKVMGMYSEELKILDQNTVRYMVDQMQEEIDSQKEQLEIKDKELQKLRRMLAEKDK